MCPRKAQTDSVRESIGYTGGYTGHVVGSFMKVAMVDVIFVLEEMLQDNKLGGRNTGLQTYRRHNEDNINDGRLATRE